MEKINDAKAVLLKHIQKIYHDSGDSLKGLDIPIDFRMEDIRFLVHVSESKSHFNIVS